MRFCILLLTSLCLASCCDRRLKVISAVELHYPKNNERLSSRDYAPFYSQKSNLALAVCDEVIKQASYRIDVDTEILRNSIRAIPGKTKKRILITAHHRDRTTAVTIANAVAEAYLEAIAAQSETFLLKQLDRIDDWTLGEIVEFQLEHRRDELEGNEQQFEQEIKEEIALIRKHWADEIRTNPQVSGTIEPAR